MLYVSSFLAGKEAKEAGGTYEWFPLDPLSTFDGDAVPLDSPCSGGGGGRFSSSGGADGTARATFYRRAMVDAGWQGLRFSTSGSAGRGYRRCGAEQPFLAVFGRRKDFRRC